MTLRLSFWKLLGCRLLLGFYLFYVNAGEIDILSVGECTMNGKIKDYIALVLLVCLTVYCVSKGMSHWEAGEMGWSSFYSLYAVFWLWYCASFWQAVKREAREKRD